MNKLMKYFYLFLVGAFALLTVYELFIYLNLDSSYVGIFYLFFTFFIMFLLLTTSINFNIANKSIRISKNIMVIVLGLFISFLLPNVLKFIFNYKDNSKYIESVFIVSKIIKPVIYILFGVISFYEYKTLKKNVK